MAGGWDVGMSDLHMESLRLEVCLSMDLRLSGDCGEMLNMSAEVILCLEVGS